MIILDTNIVSVLLDPRHTDRSRVLAWKGAEEDGDYRLTVITRAEIEYGIAILPSGARKRRLVELAEEFFASAVATGILLPFGSREAVAWATVTAHRRAVGRPISILDAQIAAIALVAGATLATRNTRDFVECGVPLVNPYDPRSRSN